jgi:cell division protein FtsA
VTAVPRLGWNRARSAEVRGFLDIGSSKVCCLILGGSRVLGVGLYRSRGVKAGVIVDLDDAEQVVRAAVDEAERAAGVTLDGVFLGVACGRLDSTTFKGHVELDRGLVRKRHLASLDGGARAFIERRGRTLIAMNRIGYRLDGMGGIREPLGMTGHRLTADFHVVTADETPLRNLLLLVERCHLAVDSLAPTPLASALAATTEEDRRHGVVCLDIGGGVTTIAAFRHGHFVGADAVPMGGKQITLDIARSLRTPLAEAERIKTLYGTLAGAASDQHEVIAFPLAGEAEPALHRTTRAALGLIVRQRIESLLQLVRERLDRSGLAACAKDPIVLTGGTSLLLGIGEFLAGALQRPVRVAAPGPLRGMPEGARGPAYSTVTGLVAAQSPDFRIAAGMEPVAVPRGYLARVGQWLEDSF